MHLSAAMSSTFCVFRVGAAVYEIVQMGNTLLMAFLFLPFVLNKDVKVRLVGNDLIWDQGRYMLLHLHYERKMQPCFVQCT